MYSNSLGRVRTSERIRDYIAIARFDHWFKNFFVLPGTALAVVLGGVSATDIWWPTLLALLATGFLASANYTINEWLDAETDRHHPLKRNRPGANGRLSGFWVIGQYFLLACLGLVIAHLLSPEFLLVSLFFLVMGFCYNVPPIRTKDRALLDVISESINNPIRLLLGWTALVSGVLPPSSILLAYWAGGAFLMTVKRYAEYRQIGNGSMASRYRKSFAWYNDRRLMLFAFFCALSSAFFLGIFLIKYRVEFLLSFPFFALLFVWYLAIGMRPDSEAQRPEKLYRNKRFVAYVFFLTALVATLFFVDVPFLHLLTEKVTY